jgi:hypothetical protein
LPTMVSGGSWISAPPWWNLNFSACVVIGIS